MSDEALKKLIKIAGNQQKILKILEKLSQAAPPIPAAPVKLNAPAERALGHGIGHSPEAITLSDMTYLLIRTLSNFEKKHEPKQGDPNNPNWQGGNMYEGAASYTAEEFNKLVEDLRAEMPDLQKGWALLNKLLTMKATPTNLKNKPGSNPEE